MDAQQHYQDALGIRQIVVSGESGGGNLCTATALKARREGWMDEIAGVYSCCPYIAGTYSPSPPELSSWHGGYVLEPTVTQALVKAYDPTEEHATDPLAWPYHADAAELEGLPPHAISVNELDPLRDEGLAYFRTLLAAGVPAYARTVNGTCHGGDMIFLGAIPDVVAATVADIRSFAYAR